MRFVKQLLVAVALVGGRSVAAVEDNFLRTLVMRSFSEYLTDGRYGWAVECEKTFGTFPVLICHEWKTIVHLNDYEGRPEARPFTRPELQRFLDYTDEQVDRAGGAGENARARWSPTGL